MASARRITDGQLSFIAGIDSYRTPTIASQEYPEGLKRSQLAWATNATMRGGGVSSRFGWRKIVSGHPWLGLYQGGHMYSPDSGYPYIVLSIGGQIYRVRVDTDNSVENITQGNNNPPLVDQAFMTQGEQFLVIQAGDYVTLPLFWDGTTMRRSVGINVPQAQREVPPAGPMDYYMGRLWFAQGRVYGGGDIVGGPSGTIQYQKRDSILHVTESPVCFGGDGFIVPTESGNIRSLAHTAVMDTALGQGQLVVATRKAVYWLNVPISRADWKLTTNDNQPLQRVIQRRYGPYGDRCVVAINGDLFYQAPDGIRSLFVALRYFQQWGNTPVSSNENRVLFFNDRALMRFASGIEFDNRLLQSALPIQTPRGVAFQGIIPLDFDLISSFQEKFPPAWEGLFEGLDILQLLEGDFGGLQRAFAVVVSRTTGNIEIWELSLSDLFDTDGANTNRIEWFFETPSFTWNKPFDPKKLDGLDLWVDRMVGPCVFTAEYKQDQSPCWQFWHAWQVAGEPEPCPNYPTQEFCPHFRATMQLPVPPEGKCDTENSRPTTVGYQFQVRIKVKGFCRIRGLLIHALPIIDQPFSQIVCTTEPGSTFPNNPTPGPVECPTFVEGPSSIQANEGDNVTLDAPFTYTGPGPLSFAWYHDSVPVGTEQTLTLSNVIASQSGEYVLVVTTPDCPISTSSAITLAVGTIPDTEVGYPLEWWNMDAVFGDQVGEINSIRLAPIAGSISAVAGLINLGQSIEPSDAGVGNFARFNAQESKLQYSGNGFTVVGWIKWTRYYAASTSYLFRYQPSVSPQTRWEMTLNTGTLALHATLNGGAYDEFPIAIAFTPVLDQWYFFMFSYDQSDGSFHFSMDDGAVVDGSNTYVVPGPLNNTPRFLVGTLGYHAGNGSSIVMDEIALYPKRLSAAEVTYIYNTGTGRTWPVVLP